MNLQGVIKYVYDNRLGKDGQANKFPNFKFGIGDHQIVLWSAILHPAIAKGKKVSVAVQESKKNGSLFVQTNEKKQPIIQELPSEDKPDTSFNPEELEKELVQVAKDFDADLTVEAKKPINKDEYMFVMALAKSAIESGKINVNKEEIDLLIKDLKFLFQMNFHN
jgi:phosphotransferase system HPr-like phosphotransfer protein